MAKDIDFHNVEINVEKGSALEISTSSEIELDNVTTQEPINGKAVVLLENVKNTVVRDCSAKKGTTDFIELRRAESQDIVLINNRLEKAQKAIKGTKPGLVSADEGSTKASKASSKEPGIINNSLCIYPGNLG